MNMNLPSPLLEIVESIIYDLPDDESQTFSDAINQAAVGKDLSLVHWAFLGSELRALSVEPPKHVQVIIDEVIAGMDRLAAGKAWSEAAKVAEDAFSTAHAVTSTTNYVDGHASYAVGYAAKAVESDEVAIYVGAAVTNILYAASYATSAKVRTSRRQRDTLLALVKGAPSVKDTEKGTTE